MSKIDLEQLAVEIRVMYRQQALYKVLREELTKVGHWRNKPRGNPAKGWKVMKDKKPAG